tara:strand:- start:96 stop:659 length:564 start_codon:yes stop_codon:yes gene_type:complete
MHPVTDPTEVVRRILVQDCRINQQTNSTVMKNIFFGLITGVLMTTAVNQPALANNTYSRAKTCYQNQYVETYHPGTREKPGYVSSREERVERPCPKTLHFHGGKSHKHQQGHRAHNHRDHPPTTSSGKTVVVDPAAEDNNSCLEGSLAGGVLGGALGGALARKDNWIWSIPAGAVGGALVGCQIDGG